MPETDSAVPGTQASKNAAETLNLQMLIGSVLLLVVMVATIAMVSVGVGRDSADQKKVEEQMQMEMQTTPIPLPSATPEPSPTPAPQITDLECRWGPQGEIDYIETTYFGLPAGQAIDLSLIWYPNTIRATPEWSVDDETIFKITPDETGMNCHGELVGEPDTETVLHIKVNEREADIRVMCM